MPVFYEAPGINIDRSNPDDGIGTILESIISSPVGSLAIANTPIALGAYIVFLLIQRGKERLAIPASGLVLVFDAWHFGLFG